MAAIALLSQNVFADAYKCTKNGKTIYQSAPCEGYPDNNKVKLNKVDPEKEAIAQQKREAIDQDLRDYNLTKAEIERKQAQAARDQAEASEAYSRAETERRHAEIRQQEADAMRRESEARARYWNKQSGVNPILGR